MKQQLKYFKEKSYGHEKPIPNRKIADTLTYWLRINDFAF